MKHTLVFDTPFYMLLDVLIYIIVFDFVLKDIDEFQNLGTLENCSCFRPTPSQKYCTCSCMLNRYTYKINICQILLTFHKHNNNNNNSIINKNCAMFPKTFHLNNSNKSNNILQSTKIEKWWFFSALSLSRLWDTCRRNEFSIFKTYF